MPLPAAAQFSSALQGTVTDSKQAFVPNATVPVNKALEIDNTLADAHASLPHIKFQYNRDWAGAEREFRRAIELNPNYADAHHWYGLCLVGHTPRPVERTIEGTPYLSVQSGGHLWRAR